MQFKKILLFFLVALPLSVALRIFQIVYVIEAETGFFAQEFEAYGNAMTVVIFAFSVAMAVFAFLSRREPIEPAKPNIVMSIGSLMFSFAVLYELAAETFPPVVKPWQVSMLNITGLLTAAYFILFAMKRFINLPLPNGFTIIPTVYLVLRVICDFTAISSLALISDNLILMAVYSVSLLFMLNFAKFYNDAGSQNASRKLLASGLCAVILCATQSVPHILVNILADYKYNHTSMAANITVFCMGAFIAAFTFSNFLRKNTVRKG